MVDDQDLPSETNEDTPRGIPRSELEGGAEPVDPNQVTPVSMGRRSKSRFLGRLLMKKPFAWLVPLGLVLGIGSIAAILLVPPLLTPPPGVSHVYELIPLGEVSAQLNPSTDLLLESHDGSISVYIPEGAFAGEGLLILQPRDFELIPNRINGQKERLRAVDLLIIDQDGVIQNHAVFDQAILLCFKTTSYQALLSTEDILIIERYVEDVSEDGWEAQITGPGWEPDQICSALDHLSIFALTVEKAIRVETPVSEPLLEPTTTADVQELYEIIEPWER